MNTHETNYGTVMISAPQEEAGGIAERIIAEKLGACAQVLPKIESYFWWEGAVQHEPESLVLVKTTRTALAGIETLLEEIHPYEVPELIFLPITGGLQAYLEWIGESTKSD
jgi:periplasmic divalent cation tolerance protein